MASAPTLCRSTEDVRRYVRLPEHGDAVGGKGSPEDDGIAKRTSAVVVAEGRIALGEGIFQDWQSECLEVLVLIVLTTYRVHKGSPEPKDGDERLRRTVERIERKVDQLANDRS